jgi:hypothetical protein
VHNDYVWQSNYCAGLRVLDEAGMNPEAMKERAYFDVAPECDTAEFSGNGVYYNALQIICLRLFKYFLFHTYCRRLVCVPLFSFRKHDRAVHRKGIVCHEG